MKQPGKVVVVTGAAGGIGTAIVRLLLRNGCAVIATDSNTDALHALHQARGASDALTTQAMDVTKPESIRAVCEIVWGRFGRVDALVNNAGVFCRTPALAVEEETMQRILDVNLAGVLRCTALFGQMMARNGGGRIVQIASMAGVTGAALASVYAASKAGVIAAARSAARELAPYKIAVNVVAPGFCDTPMLAPERAMVDRFTVPKIPAGRLADPEEVAEIVLFLATLCTPYLTGSVLTLDGGLSVG